jgi:hypothetical protein
MLALDDPAQGHATRNLVDHDPRENSTHTEMFRCQLEEVELAERIGIGIGRSSGPFDGEDESVYKQITLSFMTVV